MLKFNNDKMYNNDKVCNNDKVYQNDKHLSHVLCMTYIKLFTGSSM